MSGRASTPASAPESSSGVGGGVNESLDPLLDMALPEEQELPFMTVASTNSTPLGPDEMQDDDDDRENRRLSVVHMESGVHLSYLETMFAVGIDGCKQIRQVLDGVLKGAGKRVLAGEAGDDLDE